MTKMTKWICEIDGSEYQSREAAREAVKEITTMDDVVAQLGNTITYEDLLRELARLDSPMFYDLLDAAEEAVFHDCFYEEACDDEDLDDEWLDDDPYTLKDPMSFY